MKCLVTGGSGFIGTHVVEALLEQGHTVLNLDIKAPKLPTQRASWRQVDILDADLLATTFHAFRPTHVVHLAAKADVDGQHIDDYAVNTTGTQNVLTAVKATEQVERLIITSSQWVNERPGTPASDLDFAPRTIYGESKVVTETLTREAGLSCVWTITRPTNVWGPWHPRYPHEFWRVLGKGLYVHPGGPKVVRSYGYVKNVVFQMTQILSAAPKVVAGQVFYVGDEPVEVFDWVNAFSLAQRGTPVRVVPAIVLRSLARCGDVLKRFGARFPITTSRYQSMTTSNDVSMKKTFEAFGPPPISLHDGVAETVDWLRRHHPSLVTI